MNHGLDKNTLVEDIKEFFPSETQILSATGSTDSYSANLRLKCSTKEEFKVWLKEHENLSGVTYRVENTAPRTGKTVIYKAVFRCQHNTHPTSHKSKTPSKKHTGCKAKLKICIKSSVEGRRVRSKDVLRAEFPTVINIFHSHNHKIHSAETTKFRDPCESVRLKFLELFRNYHTPARALELHKQDLLVAFEDEYYKVAADRSICPDIQWVYRLYYSVVLPSTSFKTSANLQQNATCDVNFPYELENSKSKLNEIMRLMTDHLEEDPEEFVKAVDVMYSKMKSFTTKTELLSAMHNFGNFNCQPVALQKCSTTISVQPTLVSGGNSQIEAQKCQKSGRPTKSVFTPEHGYNKRKQVRFGENRYHPFEVPRNLEECVEFKK